MGPSNMGPSNMERDGPLRSTQVAHGINTHPSNRRNSLPGVETGNPSKMNKIKKLFGKLRSHNNVEEATNVHPVPIPSQNLGVTNRGLDRQTSNQLGAPQQVSNSRPVSNSPMPKKGSFDAGPQQPDMRHTTAIFDVNPKQQSPGQQQMGLRGSYDPYKPNAQGMSNQQQNSASGFNIFDHFQNQAQQTGKPISPYEGKPLNVPTGADPHQALMMKQYQQYPGNSQGGNAFSQQMANQSQPNTQFVDPYVVQKQQSMGSGKPVNKESSSNDQAMLESLGEHGRVKEDTSDSDKPGYNVFQKAHDAFHGKSMRSIQLFNTPTSANPKKLHPNTNPMVKADSPKSKPKTNLPARNQPHMLDIHADSCYNFLNKRRHRIAEQDFTPLEGFFLKESMNQYKVVDALHMKQVNLRPINNPGPIIRSKRYLLVLDIDETLVHSEPIISNCQPTANANKQFDKSLRFDNSDGSYDVYGVKFRPYLHEFIQRMSKLYDLAVYTASSRDYADAVMDIFDPKRTIFCSRLYRENCLPAAGMNIKNMRNFEGKDVFIVDNLIYSYAFHMSQGIPICAFVDDPMDVELQDLSEILENLPYYESMPALIQDLLGLDEFYQGISHRLRSHPNFV
jgi:Dullard-like phosphatase family protein